MNGWLARRTYVTYVGHAKPIVRNVLQCDPFFIKASAQLPVFAQQEYNVIKTGLF
jgi:hypothetical protein